MKKKLLFHGRLFSIAPNLYVANDGGEGQLYAARVIYASSLHPSFQQKETFV